MKGGSLSSALGRDHMTSPVPLVTPPRAFPRFLPVRSTTSGPIQLDCHLLSCHPDRPLRFHHSVRIARSLTVDTTRMLTQTFISCRLNYCNLLFYGITDTLYRRLQSIQNAAARLVTGTRRPASIASSPLAFCSPASRPLWSTWF